MSFKIFGAFCTVLIIFNIGGFVLVLNPYRNVQ